MAVSDLEQSTRRRILDATHLVFARSGHRNLQLSDVAAEAKVSRPTLYRWFPDKAALAEADIVVTNLIFLEEHITAILPDMQAARARVAAFARPGR